jgi:ABC exporter DevB family membrane fusion protein
MLAGLIPALTVGGAWFYSKEPIAAVAAEEPAKPAAVPPGVMFASLGRVEGLNEAIQIGAAVSGLLVAMPFGEGDSVNRGQVLARIECGPTQSERDIAMAELDAAVSTHERLLRGSRTEERLEAEANTAAAQAAVARSKLRYDRLEALFQAGVTPPDDRDQALKDFQYAEEQHKSAVQRELLIKAGALPEEIAKSEAAIRAAEHRVEQLQRQLDLCIIKAPRAGTVLRVFKHVGEAYSIVFPEPILSLADTSGFRVRAEVDERDINRVFAGQRVEVTADALEGKSLNGRVESIGAQMGRKKTRTADPAERSDRDVLEVLIDLESTDMRLVPELRVTVRFFPGQRREN